MAITDKWESGYVETYNGLARTLPRNASVCEVGVLGGGSLELWMNMFPDSEVIVGVDVDPQATWPRGTIKVISDQQDPTLPGRLRVIDLQGYHLIVDDASHEGQRTWKTFANLWPLVRPGGYYVIEDWCVGFDTYPQYDQSMVATAMMLLRLFSDPNDYPHFITYRYGMIIIAKSGAEPKKAALITP
jgi:hypothetical protein